MTEGRTLRQTVSLAAFTSGAGELATRVLVMGLGILTARLVEPRDVGILGLAVILAALVSMLGAYAETAGVMAQGSSSDATYAAVATGWRVAVSVPAVLALLLALSSLGPLLASDAVRDFEHLARIMVVLPLLETVACYPRVLLQRRLDLQYVAVCQLAQSIGFVGLAASLLVRGGGVAGVAWAQILTTAVGLLPLWFRIVRSSENLPAASRGAWRPVGLGAAKLFVGGFGGFVGERVDNLLVAGTLGPAAMGLYSMAWTASRTPVNVLSRMLNAVIVPVLPRLLGDQDRAGAALRQAFQAASALVTVSAAGLFAVSAPATELVLGAKWLPLVPGLRIMCVTVCVSPFLFIAAASLTTTGNAHRIGLATVVHLTVLVLLLPRLASAHGVLGAAIADLVAMVAATATMLFVAWRRLGRLGWAEPAVIARTAVAGILAALVADFSMRGAWTPLISTAGRGVVVVLVYVVASVPLGFWPTLREMAATLVTAIASQNCAVNRMRKL